ncbi:MAG TPA: hypothetical protein VGH56_04755 [Solirubrobacteraceae bacterium]
MPGITLPAKTLLAVFAASLSLLGLTSAAQAPAATFTFGLADYEPATFSDPRVAALGVHTARDVVPWNVALVPRERAAVSAWLAAVRRASITPLITFQHAGNNSRAPGKAQFLRAFLRFRALFPWVTEFCPWNEATHSSQPTARHPRLAAQYYNAIASHCSGCTVTAPDTLDADGNIESWIGTFLQTARPYPKVWPFNPYLSVRGNNPRAIRRLLSFVHGQVWFSEVGGIVWWRFHGRLIYRGWPMRGGSPRTSLGLRASAHGSRASITTTGARPGLPRPRRSPPGTRGSSARAASRAQHCSPSRKPSTGISRPRRRAPSNRWGLGALAK